MTQGRQPTRTVIVVSGKEDVRLAVLSGKLKAKGSKKVDALKLSPDGALIQFILVTKMKVDRCSQKKRCNACPGLRFLLPELKIL